MPREKFSFLRYLFPSLQQQARRSLQEFKYETLPLLKARAQSRIYASIVKHQQKKRRKLSKRRIFPTITAHGRRKLTDERSAIMDTYYPEGSKRAKIAGYLQAANKLRQDYQAKRVGAEDYPDVPGAQRGVKVSRHGNDELILFPSYARHHVKGRLRYNELRADDNGGDAEYWKREWEMHEDANAVVDVDIRGWVYSNMKGPMNRRSRLILTVARQLSGIPAPDGTSGYSSSSLADANSHSARHENEIALREAENIKRRGERESEAAEQGAYSTRPEDSFDGSRDSDSSGASTPRLASSLEAIANRESWSDPSEFTPAELERANGHLTTRLRPFLTQPSMNAALTIFFYNSETSQSRTTLTNEYGHFNFRAALNFVPTHVRVLAGERLSATEEVIVTESSGISVISDIDDTIKHSAITAGAKEIFRNTFIRELAELMVDGVRQWYGKMHKAGAKFHYVSNSPWQLYSLLAEYFSVAGLPPGSIHLKQYTGVLQGIFEPAAERKKGSLDRILGDFPDRKFILVGDSGEADLEVYTDVALANPKRIVAIFIRDVTSPKKQGLGFFNSSMASKFSSSQFSPTRAERPESRPALPPRPVTNAQEAEEDLIDLSDDYNPPPPSRTSTDPTKLGPAVTATALPLRFSHPSAATDQPIARKPGPPRPPKPRHFSSNPVNSSSDSDSFTAEAVRNKFPSLDDTVHSSGSSIAHSRDSSPAPVRATPPTPPPPRFGQGSLAFVGDGNKTNDRPAPLLPPRRLAGTGSGAGTGTDSCPRAAALTGGPAGSAPANARHFSDLPPTNKKEEMFKRRWLRAKEMLADKGIVLKAWKVGTDVMDEAVKLIEEAKMR